jgi:hypothetical protein
MRESGTTEELTKLSREIALLREELRAASTALNRIEKRLKLVFPVYEPQENKRPTASRNLPPSQRSREELLGQFEELLKATIEGGDSAFADRCRAIPEQDLVALAFELGVSDRKHISVAKARTGIRGRVQESMLLSGSHSASPKV